MLTKKETDAINDAKGASQAAKENAKYQSRKRAEGGAGVPEKLAKFRATQRPGKR